MKSILLAGAVAALLPLGASAAQLSSQDRSFMEHAAIGGLAEVQEGQLAQAKAATPQVKQFGQRMVQDHTPNNQELMALAKQKGVTPPAALDSTHKQEIATLQKNTGAAFDRDYIKRELSDHQEMTSLLQQEIQSGTDPDVKAFAQKTLPVIQEHLRMAQQLQGQG
jgi:putative membrane protein